MPIVTLTASEDQTAALGHALAAILAPGDVVLLDGPVGAGKSHLARALIRARLRDPDAEIPSPTFTLVQSYADPNGVEIWHADLYRLGDPDELVELGLDEAMDHAICLIEWPDRFDLAPSGALHIRLDPVADQPELREIRLSGPMVNRVRQAVNIAQFLTDAGWGDAYPVALAGDASSRRYFRLTESGRSAVLMDAPDEGVRAYVAMTDWLRERGFHAPEILAATPESGLLLLEDLGDDLLAARLAAEPDLAPAAYRRVTDLLVDLHRHTPPDFIPALDGSALADQVGLFGEFYAPAVGVDLAPLGPVILRLYDQLCADTAPVCALRDFHAENIFWRHPLGLIDFQDAVATHPAYDLVSCLQDARRDVAPEIEADCIARYITLTERDEAQFRAAYALLGAQRNLRIMGIFTRLAQQDGKKRYLAMMPRVWDAVARNLTHPALAPLAGLLAEIPAPSPAIIERIAA